MAREATLDGRVGFAMHSVLTNRLGACSGVLVAMLLAMAPPSATPAEVPSAGDIAELKRQYLACDRQATTRRLSLGEAHVCSLVAEALLQREFEGDFERLLAWWRSRRQSTSPAP